MESIFQDSILQRGKILGLKQVRVAWERGSPSVKEFTLFWNSQIWVINWLTFVENSSRCIDNSTLFACLTRSVLHHVLKELKGQFQFSIQTSAHRLACCSWNLCDLNSWVTSQKAIPEYLNCPSVPTCHFVLQCHVEYCVYAQLRFPHHLEHVTFPLR